MAKKRRQKQSLKAKRAQTERGRPAARLEQAQSALQAGNLPQALELATAAHSAANDPRTLAASATLLAELHLRSAAAAPRMAVRLQHLDAALAFEPANQRINYHFAVALLLVGRPDEAWLRLADVPDSAFDHVDVLRQLALAASGEPWSAAGLASDMADAVAFVAEVAGGAPAELLLAASEQRQLPGGDSNIWRALLRMLANDKSAPINWLQEAITAETRPYVLAILHYYHGVALMRARRDGEALAAWRTALALGSGSRLVQSNHTQMVRQQAQSLADQGQWSAALATATQIEDQSDDKVLQEVIGFAHFNLGYQAAEQQQWRSAAHHFRQAEQAIQHRLLSQNLALAEEALENWEAAAEAWREMVRRRPRRTDHPDYLSDNQVAAIWRHAAHCYLKTDYGDSENAVTCFQHAVKYAPGDIDLRLELAALYVREGRGEAAENELVRILEQQPDHAPALKRLAALSTNRWDRDPIPLWKRVLAVSPDDDEARDELAKAYVARADGAMESSLFSSLLKRPPKGRLKILQEGLEALPDHPLLLLEMGKAQRTSNKKQARAYLRRAWEAAPRDSDIVFQAMHELLHADGGDIVEELLPRTQEMDQLLASFWIEQGEFVLKCQLDLAWARRFWQEALRLSEMRRADDTPAFTLLRIFDVVADMEYDELASEIEAQAKAMAPQSGAVEYIEAARSNGNREKTLRLMRRAKRKAQRANEPGVMRQAEQMIMLLEDGPGRLLSSLFGDLDSSDLRDMLDDMEGLDEFPDIF